MISPRVLILLCRWLPGVVVAIGALWVLGFSREAASATGIQVVKHLGGAETGQHPVGGLLKAEDGFFYGTSREGGRYGYGTIYRVTREGTITLLVNLDGTQGRHPEAALTAHSDGNFY